MLSPKYFIVFMLLMAAELMLPSATRAQQFSVKSFRMLENDVTAFVDPVKDLNDEGCALIKVEADPDFVFSTPLGIVKRTDKAGEIWIYLPKGSKKITVKHPQWGVLRDFLFPSKLESRVSYEMKLDTPADARLLAGDEGRITTVHDTLLLVRTDTLLLATPAKKIPLKAFAEATLSFGGSAHTVMGGLMAGVMKRHGGFLHLATDFGHIGRTDGKCDKDGHTGNTLPFYTGETRHSALIATAGAIHRISRTVNIFEGIGYGYDRTAWQRAESSGGGYLRNTHYSTQGFAFEIGALCVIRRVSISASLSSIKGKQWYGNIGIGIRIGKL